MKYSERRNAAYLPDVAKKAAYFTGCSVTDQLARHTPKDKIMVVDV